MGTLNVDPGTTEPIAIEHAISITPNDGGGAVTGDLGIVELAGWDGATWRTIPVDSSGHLKATVDAAVSTPVFVRLSDGNSAITTLPISVASLPSHPVTNAGTFAVQATMIDGASVTIGSKADAKSSATDTTAITIMQVLKQISASVQAPGLPTGASTETSLGTRLSEADFDTKTGSLTETAPASDTASSGVNGRLQRIAQRLTSLIALVPTSLGQKTKAASFAVTIASDQDALAVTPSAVVDTSATGNITIQDTSSTDTTTNSQLSMHLITGTPTVGSSVQVATGGRSSVVIQVAASGSQWTGTLQFERSADGGITWSQVTAVLSSASNVLNSCTGNGIFVIAAGGFTHARIRATAAIANTAAITLAAASGNDVILNANGTRLFDNTTSSSLTITSGAASVAPIAGTNIIGKVTTDQTTHGTSDLVAADLTKVAGTAVDVNSGTKSAGTQRQVLATDQPTLTSLLAQVSASLETNSIYQGTTALTPKFATIVASSSGATTIVAAVSNKKIRVLGYVLTFNAAVNAKWQSHVTPTDKTGLAYGAANGGIAAAFNPVGHFETISGEALDINLSGAVAVGGHLLYVEA